MSQYSIDDIIELPYASALSGLAIIIFRFLVRSLEFLYFVPTLVCGSYDVVFSQSTCNPFINCLVSGISF